MSTLLIEGGRVLCPCCGRDAIMDIYCEDGKIKSFERRKADRVIDARGYLVTPGFVDLHTHSREPGREDEETVYTLTLSAAAGGFTTVLLMPNTQPPLDNKASVSLLKEIVQRDSFIECLLCGAITKGMKGEELAPFWELKEAGVLAFSDDGGNPANSRILRRALEYIKMLNVPVILHSEDVELSAGGVMNEGFYSSLLGLSGSPSAAEAIAVSKNIALARLTDAHVHIAHISTKEAVSLVRSAKKEDIRVTAETCPHYFTLTDEKVCTFDTNTKVNPPLRSREDTEAIIEGVCDGTIDCIATDHAPHSKEEKEREYAEAPFGIVGHQTAFPLALTHLVRKGHISLLKLVELLSTSAAKILHLHEKGKIEPGADADILIIDEEREWRVEEERILSKSKNTPYLGEWMKGFVKTVIVKGEVVMEEGRCL
jgi:dihydroorotase